MFELDSKTKKLINEDFYNAKETLELALIQDKRFFRSLYPLSILGHISEGHGLFKGKEIPDIELDDIYRALNFNPTAEREFNTKLCFELFEWHDAVVKGKRNKFVNKKGRPLFGIPFYEDFVFEANDDLFKAGAKVGTMDDNVWRKKTAKKYSKTLDGEDYSIGSGDEYLMDKQILKDLNLTPLELARTPHSEEDIQNYISIGLIVENERAGEPNIENIFVRHEVGLGICDDNAMCIAIAQHGKAGAMLGLAVDCADTRGKAVTTSFNGGIDGEFAKYIMNSYKERTGVDLISPEEIMEFIYLSSKNNIKISYFSSSHRRFIQKEPGSKDFTFLEHMRFIETGRYNPNYRLGFHRTSSKKFYENVRERFYLYGNGFETIIPNGKQKIPRSKKKKGIKIIRPPKIIYDSKIPSVISTSQKHDDSVDKIAKNPSLIGLEDIIGAPEKEKSFYYPPKNRNKSGLAGKADLFFETLKGYVVVEYKSGSSIESFGKAKNQLIKAEKYLQCPKDKLILLCVSGNDFKTQQLVREPCDYNNKNNPCYSWKEFK